MDDLEITIVLKYNVPEKGLTFNGLLRGLEKGRDAIMRSLLRAILEALENQALAAYQEVSPGRYIRNGRQPNLRKFLTSFGELRYRLAQMMDHRTGAVFCPLAKRLAIIPYRQYQRESLEGGIGQAVHLSYRLAASETRRLLGHGPNKSTLHRRLQELAEDHGAWPALKHRPFKFLMVDGTKVALQEQGRSLGHSELRWALASEDVGRPFSLVGFWVNQNWESIRRELSRRLNYSRLRVLFSDGDPAIEDYLLSARMDQQRCIWHGQRDFSFLLYADRVKGKAQKPLRELLAQNPLFHLQKADLEAFSPADEPLLRKLVKAIRRCFRDLLTALPVDKYPKTRTYVENFSRQAMTFFDYWLDRQEWIPLTTNAIESSFSRVVNRIKRIGRRWSENGLTNWLAIACRKILHPSMWTSLWKQYLRLHRSLSLMSLRVEYRWI
jgi:transposase-like protein